MAVALLLFSSYEIINSTLLIDPLACRCAATSKEYACTFSTIKSGCSAQNGEHNGQYLSNCCYIRAHYSQFWKQHFTYFLLTDSVSGSCKVGYYTFQSASTITRLYKPSFTRNSFHKWNQTDLRATSTQGGTRALYLLYAGRNYTAAQSCNHVHLIEIRPQSAH